MFSYVYVFLLYSVYFSSSSLFNFIFGMYKTLTWCRIPNLCFIITVIFDLEKIKKWVLKPLRYISQKVNFILFSTFPLSLALVYLSYVYHYRCKQIHIYIFLFFSYIKGSILCILSCHVCSFVPCFILSL